MGGAPPASEQMMAGEREPRYREAMASIHTAELTPSKPEVLRGLLATQPWGSPGEMEILGAYRFDDPAGQVGVECHLLAVRGRVLHVPLTYRGAPLRGAEKRLVSRMHHSVLGERYVYDGIYDPVARDCFARALRGEQEQARLDIVDAQGRTVDQREQSVIISREGSGESHSSGAALGELPAAGSGEPTILRRIEPLDEQEDASRPGAPRAGAARLIATWSTGRGVVALL